MAREIFSSQAPTPEQIEQSKSEVRPKRRPLAAKHGPASSKHLKPSAVAHAERTYHDVPLVKIRDSKIQDRISVEDGLDDLVEDIREDGQQMPIIIRPVEEDAEGRTYEIVVGRRRMAALRRLGKPTAKAFVTRLTDSEAFRLQGTENNQRLDTSFIERARAAALAAQEGITQGEIASFLGSDRTLVNKMHRIYSDLGEDLVKAIGAAHGVGRRKWEALATAIAAAEVPIDEVLDRIVASLPSDQRFSDILTKMQRLAASREGKAPSAPAADVVSRSYLDGALSTRRRPDQLVVKLGKGVPDHLLDQLESRLSDLVDEWKEDVKK